MPSEQPLSELNATLFPYFGPVPLLPGEDPVGYDGLLARVASATRPKDIIEEIWVQEIVALSWEVFRLRRMKAAFLTARRGVGISQALEAVCRPVDRQEFAAAYARQDPEVLTVLAEQLASAKVTPDMITALTITSSWELMERIDRVILASEMRRDSVLREIERRRASFAAALRAQVRIEDAPVIDADQASGPAPSGSSAG